MPNPVCRIASRHHVLIVLWLLLLPFGALIAQPAYPIPSGVYCSCGPTMATGPGSVDPTIASKPFVKGILVRIGWNLVEPSSGVYNWAQLDTQLARARFYGKKVALSVVNGPSAPAWLYAAGVQNAIVGAPFNDTIPYPWDPVYLAKWKELIARLGERYDHDTTITLVHMTNASANGFEFFLNPTTLFDWNNAGYTDAKMIDSWKQVVDAFGAAFPEHYLDNDFHPIFLTGNSSNVPGDSVYAYARRTLGARYGAFSSWWSQKNTATYARQYADLRASAGSTFATVQFAYNGTRDSAAFGPGGMPGALGLAIDDGICYWEIWNQDILNPAFDSLLNAATCSSTGDVAPPSAPVFSARGFSASIAVEAGGRDMLIRCNAPSGTPSGAPLELRVVDMAGRTVLRRTLSMSGGASRVDVSALSAGAYLVDLRVGGEAVGAWKVVLFGGR